VVGVWKCMQERSTTKEVNERNAVERVGEEVRKELSVEKRKGNGCFWLCEQDVRCKKCSTTSGTSEVKWRERDGAKRNEASGMNERGTRRVTQE
jgi:hypothetical protein